MGVIKHILVPCANIFDELNFTWWSCDFGSFISLKMCNLSRNIYNILFPLSQLGMWGDQQICATSADHAHLFIRHCFSVGTHFRLSFNKHIQLQHWIYTEFNQRINKFRRKAHSWWASRFELMSYLRALCLDLRCQFDKHCFPTSPSNFTIY